MARAKAKPVSRRAQHESQIRRMVVLDALQGMGVPAIAAAGIFVLWVLFNAELLHVGVALSMVGILALFIMAHFGLRNFLSERTSTLVAAGVGVFALAWIVGLGWPLHATINAPPPVFAGELKVNAAPSTVPLNGATGQYRIVVSGHVPQTNDRASHGGHYRIHVNDDANLDSVIEGDFSENWQRQRIGRRGGLPVRVVHSVTQHRIISSSGHDLSLALAELNGNAGTSVGVEVFMQAVSTTLLAAIGLVLTAAALVVDALRADATREGVMTMETLAAVGGIAAFRAFGAAHAGFGDLLVNGLVGGVPGAAAGALLWRVAGAHVRKLIATE